MKLPSSCSWTMRKLFKLRGSFIKHIIGDGASTFFWQDNQHPVGPLLNHLGSQFVIHLATPWIRVLNKGCCVLHWPSRNRISDILYYYLPMYWPILADIWLYHQYRYVSPYHNFKSCLGCLIVLYCVFNAAPSSLSLVLWTVFWYISRTSKYQIASTWPAIRVQIPVAPWHNIVWFQKLS